MSGFDVEELKEKARAALDNKRKDYAAPIIGYFNAIPPEACLAIIGELERAEANAALFEVALQAVVDGDPDAQDIASRALEQKR